MWLVIHLMYGVETAWLAQNLPGGGNRTNNAIQGHLSNMRLGGNLPKRWTIRADENDRRPWTMEEDIEIMRWNANDRINIDVKVFMEMDRSGTAVFKRAKFLMQDSGLDWACRNIELRQRRALLESDSAGDTSAAETAAEEQATEDIRQAILQSLSSRPPMLQ